MRTYLKTIFAIAILTNPVTYGLFAISAVLCVLGVAALLLALLATTLLLGAGILSAVGYLIVSWAVAEVFRGQSPQSKQPKRITIKIADEKYSTDKITESPEADREYRNLDTLAQEELSDYLGEVRASLAKTSETLAPIDRDSYTWDGTWPTVDKGRMGITSTPSFVTVLANACGAKAIPAVKKSKTVKSVKKATKLPKPKAPKSKAKVVKNISEVSQASSNDLPVSSNNVTNLSELSIEELLAQAKARKIRGVNSRWSKEKLIEKLSQLNDSQLS